MDRGKPGKIPQENTSRNDPEGISSIFEKKEKKKKQETNILIYRFKSKLQLHHSQTQKKHPKNSYGVTKEPT